MFASDLAAQSGTHPRVVVGNPRSGDIALRLDPALTTGPEGYRLTIGPSITISAPTVTGDFYGTQTLLQWLQQRTTLPAGTVNDWPRYPERGLGLDLGRVPFDATYIEQQIRQLAYLKMNYLQLNLSDDSAFRIESDRHPEIVSPQHLTKDQVRTIVALAARYHVQVVPVIDMPGHMGAILAKHPEFQLRNVLGQADATRLDISNPAAVAFVKDILDELMPLFPSTYWHLGGDEYMKSVEYATYPNLLSSAIRRYGLGATGKDAFLGFLNDMNAFVRAHGYTARVYNDEAAGGSRVTLNPTIVVDWWADVSPLSDPISPTPQQLLATGHKILNNGWWPTYYNSPGTPTPDMGEAYNNWQVNEFHSLIYYNYTLALPSTFIAADDTRNLGARLSVWGDGPLGTDPAAIAAGVLPRLQVIAQKTWASPQRLDYSQFQALGAGVGRAP